MKKVVILLAHLPEAVFLALVGAEPDLTKSSLDEFCKSLHEVVIVEGFVILTVGFQLRKFKLEP